MENKSDCSFSSQFAQSSIAFSSSGGQFPIPYEGYPFYPPPAVRAMLAAEGERMRAEKERMRAEGESYLLQVYLLLLLS